jgi:hypothetical protein
MKMHAEGKERTGKEKEQKKQTRGQQRRSDLSAA